MFARGFMPQAEGICLQPEWGSASDPTASGRDAGDRLWRQSQPREAERPREPKPLSNPSGVRARGTLALPQKS